MSTLNKQLVSDYTKLECELREVCSALSELASDEHSKTYFTEYVKTLNEKRAVILEKQLWLIRQFEALASGEVVSLPQRQRLKRTAIGDMAENVIQLNFKKQILAEA